MSAKDQEEQGNGRRRGRIKFIKHNDCRDQFPVIRVLPIIHDKLIKDRVLVVVGETGSGKTTQIPQYLYRKGLAAEGIIGVTQPRRIAAISIANWVSKECGAKLGEEVGYAVRFDDATSSKTKIKYMTDGILLRELMLDNQLKSYSCIILDEVHERTCRTDILLGIVKNLLRERPRLKVIVMSATLDTLKFSSYFNNCEIVKIAGRRYPVRIFSPLTQLEDYLDAVLSTIFQIHVEMPTGDILVFLTGQEEIENMKRIVEENARTLPPTYPKMQVVSIYASMPLERQAKLFIPTPSNYRKVVLSTNISETSITIPKIKYVIDTGVAKVRDYDQRTGLETLSIRPISKLSSEQRAGRAGRDSPGSCYRLYTKDVFEKLPDFMEPEILRTDISSIILSLKTIGVDNVLSFDFIDRPSRSAVISSLKKLYLLGALDEDGKITELGKKMAIFPISPEYTKSILVSSSKGCLEQVVSIISMLSVEPIFWIPLKKREEVSATKKRFGGSDSDHILLLNIMNAYIEVGQDPKWCADNFINGSSMKTAMKIKNQLINLCAGAKLKFSNSDKPPDDRQILASIASGFFRNISSRQQAYGAYVNILSRIHVYIHPSSCLFDVKPELVLYNEIVTTSKNYMHNCSKISPEWLQEVLPEHYKIKLLNSTIS